LVEIKKGKSIAVVEEESNTCQVLKISSFKSIKDKLVEDRGQ
jgi:hypothetical protein